MGATGMKILFASMQLLTTSPHLLNCAEFTAMHVIKLYCYLSLALM